MRTLVGGTNVAYHAYNAVPVQKGVTFQKGVLFMPDEDGDIIGIPLENDAKGSTVSVTVPNQLAGAWCNVVFASIDVATSAGGIMTYLDGLQNRL
jgi:hypothetical protein